MKYHFSYLFILFFALSIFAQKNEPNTKIKFVQLTDLHVSVGNDNDFLLQKIVTEINNSDNEFVVITGDLTNRGANDELEQVHATLEKLIKPYHVISGNHETNWSESAGLTYKKLWGADRFVFSKGDYLFVGYPCGPYMKMGDGFVKHEDILWLDQTLKDSLKNNTKKVLNFAHYPLDNSVSNNKEVLGVLEKYPTVATFCGHGHTLRKYDFSGLNGIMGTSITSLDGKVQSYNEIVVSQDSISIYQKELQKAVFFKFSVSTKPSNINIPKDSIARNRKSFIKDIASIYSVPTFDKDNIYFTNSLGEIKSVDLTKKKLNWKIETNNSIYFTPLVYKNTVVIGSIDEYLSGYDKKTGKEKWKTPIGGILVGSPIVENDKIYTATSTKFVCVDANSGKLLWENKLPVSYSQGTPLIHGENILFGAWDTFLYCLNKNTGELVWKWNNGSKQVLYSPGNINMVASKSRLYIVAPDRNISIIDINNGETLLRTNQWKVRESMGKSEDGKYFYAKTMNGELLRLPLNDEIDLTEENLISASLLLDLKLGYEHNPAPILENKNLIYVGSKKGEVVVIDARKFQIKNILYLGSSSVNGFTLDEKGRVWTSLIEGSLFLLD